MFAARQAMHRILHGMDDRMIVVIGPCSIHDTRAAIEYAKRLKPVRDRLSADLEIVSARTSRSRAPRWAGRG